MTLMILYPVILIQLQNLKLRSVIDVHQLNYLNIHRRNGAMFFVHHCIKLKNDIPDKVHSLMSDITNLEAGFKLTS